MGNTEIVAEVGIQFVGSPVAADTLPAAGNYSVGWIVGILENNLLVDFEEFVDTVDWAVAQSLVAEERMKIVVLVGVAAALVAGSVAADLEEIAGFVVVVDTIAVFDSPSFPDHAQNFFFHSQLPLQGLQHHRLVATNVPSAKKYWFDQALFRELAQPSSLFSSPFCLCQI